MATELRHKWAIQRLNFGYLAKLWNQIKNGKTPDWNPGKAFEYLVLRAYELEGAEVQYPFSAKLQGYEVEQIDGVVYCDGLSALLECKDSTAAKNVEPIAKLRNQLQRRPAPAIGMIFSRGGFTEPARSLSYFLSPQTILLWQGDEIEAAFLSQKMIQATRMKYRYAVEQGLTDFNVLAEGVV